MAPVSQKKLRLTTLGLLFLAFLGGSIWLFLVGPFLNTHERWLMIARVATYTLGIPIALLTTKILRVKRTWDYVYNNLALWSFLLLVAFPSIYNGLISPDSPYLNFWHVGLIWQIGLLLLAIFFMTSSFRLTQPIQHQHFPRVVIFIHVLQLIFIGAVAFGVASTAQTLLADKRTIYILFLILNIIQALLFFIAMVKQIITYNYRGVRVFFWNGLAAMALFFASVSFSLYNIGDADFLVLFYGFVVLGLLCLLLGLFNEQYRFLESETKLRESLERSLQETDQLLKSREIMLDEILVGIYMLDAHGVLVFANAHFCRLLKYDRSRLLGQNFRHFISNQSLEKFELEHQKWRENVSGQVELIFVGKSKSTIPMLMLTSPVFTRQRRYAGSRHAVIPIQRWKDIEKELRDRSQNLERLVLERSADLQRKSEEQAFSKNYYEALIGGMREIMLVMNQTGKCTFLNRYGQEILGYTANELSNRNMPQFFLDFNHLRKEYGDSMNIEVRDYEQELRTQKGRRIVCSWNVQHLPDLDGKPMGIMFVGHDVTDRQQLQRQLENQTHNLEQLAEQRNAELNRKVSQLNKIIQIGEDIILNLDLNVILNNICEAIRTLGWQVVIIALRDFESNRINFVQAAGINEKKFSEISHQKRLDFKHLLSLMNDEYRISHSYFIDHSQKVFDFDRSQFSVFGRSQPKVNQWHADDALLVPIKIQSKILGFIIVQQPQYPTMPPDRDQTRSLEIFANKAAVVIENARLYREARQQAGEMKRLSQMKSEFLANMSHE
ncbi:PAS domain S-box protein, partial [bacterium]|nr:PAS domain S-box protein [bacterium]